VRQETTGDTIHSLRILKFLKSKTSAPGYKLKYSTIIQTLPLNYDSRNKEECEGKRSVANNNKCAIYDPIIVQW